MNHHASSNTYEKGHEAPRLVAVQYTTWEEQGNSSRKDGVTGTKKEKNKQTKKKKTSKTQLWMGVVVKVKSSVVRNKIA